MATYLTVATRVRGENLAPSIATKLDLKRCYTVDTTKNVRPGSTVSLIEGEKVLVRGAIPTNRKTVTTVLKLSKRAIRGIARRVPNTSITGCGYPKRVMVAKGATTMRGTTRSLGTIKTGETILLGMDNPFRSGVLRDTNRRLTGRVRGEGFRPLTVPCIAGIATGCIASVGRAGTLLTGRVSSPMQ